MGRYIKVDLKIKRVGKYRLDVSGSGQGPVAGFCDYGDSSVSIKGGEFLDKLRDC
jgi:hypothetical protein